MGREKETSHLQIVQNKPSSALASSLFENLQPSSD